MKTYTRVEVQAAVVQMTDRLKGRRDMNRRTAEAQDLRAAGSADAQAIAQARAGAYQVALDDLMTVFGGGLLADGPAVAKARVRRKPRRK